MATTCFKAGEAISIGDAVFLSTAGFIFKASSLVKTQASVIGLALDSGTFGDLIRVNTDSVYTYASGLVPGEFRYLGLLASGTTTTYSTWFNDLSLTTYSGAYLTQIGRAVSTSGLSIELSKPTFINRSN